MSSSQMSYIGAPPFPNHHGPADDGTSSHGRQVFESCYLSYFDNLVAGLRRLHGDNGFDAEDVAHRAFEKLALKLQRTEVQNPEAYVWRVAQNFALRDRRSQNTQARYGHEIAQATITQVTPERVLIGLQELKRVNVALASLSERRRQIFLLRQIDGLNYTEIADRIGISRTAVAKHLAKAVEEIDRFLTEGA